MAGVNEPLWASYYIVSGGIIISNFTPFLHFAEGEEEEKEKGRAAGSKPFPGDGWQRSPREAKDAPRPQPQTIGLPSAAHPELACHSPVGLEERIKARPTCAPGPLCRSESGSPAPPREARRTLTGRRVSAAGSAKCSVRYNCRRRAEESRCQE